MFRFWYRYVFANRTLLETNAQEAVWEHKIANDYSNYMGLVFEKICQDYLLQKNSQGELPILFTSIGRWWGTDPATHNQEEIDIIAGEGNHYLICECKWKNEKTDLAVLHSLQSKADIFRKTRDETWYILFYKSHNFRFRLRYPARSYFISSSRLTRVSASMYAFLLSGCILSIYSLARICFVLECTPSDIILYQESIKQKT